MFVVYACYLHAFIVYLDCVCMYLLNVSNSLMTHGFWKCNAEVFQRLHIKCHACVWGGGWGLVRDVCVWGSYIEMIMWSDWAVKAGVMQFASTLWWCCMPYWYFPLCFAMKCPLCLLFFLSLPLNQVPWGVSLCLCWEAAELSHRLTLSTFLNATKQRTVTSDKAGQ